MWWFHESETTGQSPSTILRPGSQKNNRPTDGLGDRLICSSGKQMLRYLKTTIDNIGDSNAEDKWSIAVFIKEKSRGKLERGRKNGVEERQEIKNKVSTVKQE